jgi:hypothetical protein
MQLKVYNIINLLRQDKADVLSKMVEEESDGVTAFCLSHNLTAIAQKLADYEAARVKLINKYGAKVGETNKIEVTKENMDVYSKEMTEVMEQDIEVDIYPINPARISNHTAIELIPIQWMFKLETN